VKKKVLLNEMPSPTKIKRIGLLGHYGNKNMGDDATLQSVISNIREHCPDAEIFCFSPNPEDTQKRHRVRAFPLNSACKRHRASGAIENAHNGRTTPLPASKLNKIKALVKHDPLLHFLLKPVLGIVRRLFLVAGELGFIVNSYRESSSLDLMIISGGGQLDDSWGGPWGSPFILLKWAIIGKASGTKLLFISVGAGPIKFRLSRFFIKFALNFSNYRSYRDESSRKLIQAIGVKGEDFVFPDIAYSLTVNRRDTCEVRGEHHIVGISPMAYLDHRCWPENDKEFYESYVKKIAALTLWLIQRQYIVSFFCSQLIMDAPVIQDVKRAMENMETAIRWQHIIEPPVNSVKDLVNALGMCYFVVASRLHGVILSHLLYKPVIALSYHEKIDMLMADMGHSDYCLDINNFSLDVLKDRVYMLQSYHEILTTQIRNKVSSYKLALENQYNRIFEESFSCHHGIA
jgi:polysaccharide pyruvyl transferase WcaK-like protein